MRGLTILLAIFYYSFINAFEFTTDFANGIYWSQYPVVFEVEESNPVKKEFLEKLIEQSIIMWEEAAGENVWQLGAEQVTRNIIRWSNNFGEETGYDPKTTLAITSRRPSGPHIAMSEIILNSESYISQDWNALFTVIVHEMGHTVGLGHSKDTNAVMGEYINLAFEELARDDVEGIQEVVEETIYRQDSNYVSPSAAQSSESDAASALSCGTVDMSGNGPGAGNILFSLLSGLGLALLTRKPRQVKVRAS